jgi:hypothetical protein
MQTTIAKLLADAGSQLELPSAFDIVALHLSNEEIARWQPFYEPRALRYKRLRPLQWPGNDKVN